MLGKKSGLAAAMALVAALLGGMAAPQAAPQVESFGHWTVQSEETDTGEDVRKVCTASASFIDAAGNTGALTLTISDGDALPPVAYPAVTIAVANNGLPKGDNIPAVFSASNGKVEATVYADDASSGQLLWQMNNETATTLSLLRVMRRATGALDLSFAGKSVGAIPTDGFTKAYRRLGSLCGFPTDDVAP